MPFYRYQAFDRQGKSVSGSIDASSEQHAKELLRSKRLMPTKVVLAEKATGVRPFFLRLFEPRVDSMSKIRFTKQLGVLIKSGVPLLQAIELLAQQFEGVLQRILLDVKDRLQAGEAFATALARYPRIFSSVYIQLIRAGEATGKLENILARLHDYLEKIEETKKRLKKAATYPIVMISLAVGLTVGLLIGLVPMFGDMFQQMRMSPPELTEYLMTASIILKKYYLTIIFSIAAIVVLFLYWRSTVKGKRRLDEWSLRLPLVSYISKTKAVVQFSNTLGMLLDSGVNLAEALDIVCNIIDNTVLIDTLQGARDKIIKEGKIAHYLKETGMFPPIASYMISTGEESGELATMLLSVGRDYDIELGERIDVLIAIINPILLLVVGGVVVLMIAGLFLPIFDMMGKLG